MEYNYPQAVIRTPEEFTKKYRRLIRTMIELAIKKDVFHQRDSKWIDEMIERNYARGFINDDRVTGFCVVRPVYDENSRPVYAESCLWKNKYRKQAQYMLITEAQKIGDSMYGAFYSTNTVAREFYALDHGYQYITDKQLPVSIRHELSKDLDKITLLFHPLQGDIEI